MLSVISNLFLFGLVFDTLFQLSFLIVFGGLVDLYFFFLGKQDQPPKFLDTNYTGNSHFWNFFLVLCYFCALFFVGFALGYNISSLSFEVVFLFWNFLIILYFLSFISLKFILSILKLKFTRLSFSQINSFKSLPFLASMNLYLLIYFSFFIFNPHLWNEVSHDFMLNSLTNLSIVIDNNYLNNFIERFFDDIYLTEEVTLPKEFHLFQLIICSFIFFIILARFFRKYNWSVFVSVLSSFFIWYFFICCYDGIPNIFSLFDIHLGYNLSWEQRRSWSVFFYILYLDFHDPINFPLNDFPTELWVGPVSLVSAWEYWAGSADLTSLDSRASKTYDYLDTVFLKLGANTGTCYQSSISWAFFKIFLGHFIPMLLLSFLTFIFSTIMYSPYLLYKKIFTAPERSDLRWYRLNPNFSKEFDILLVTGTVKLHDFVAYYKISDLYLEWSDLFLLPKRLEYRVTKAANQIYSSPPKRIYLKDLDPDLSFKVFKFFLKTSYKKKS